MVIVANDGECYSERVIIVQYARKHVGVTERKGVFVLEQRGERKENDKEK